MAHNLSVGTILTPAHTSSPLSKLILFSSKLVHLFAFFIFLILFFDKSLGNQTWCTALNLLKSDFVFLSEIKKLNSNDK